mmetsp:Transcript_67751/g.220551  ORF Transcript_67751/g.220551 Transcript_67751/m.220551 type:complete len:201 (-) Transcript_67751:998-1600(-)
MSFRSGPCAVQCARRKSRCRSCCPKPHAGPVLIPVGHLMLVRCSYLLGTQHLRRCGLLRPVLVAAVLAVTPIVDPEVSTITIATGARRPVDITSGAAGGKHGEDGDGEDERDHEQVRPDQDHRQHVLVWVQLCRQAVALNADPNDAEGHDDHHEGEPHPRAKLSNAPRHDEGDHREGYRDEGQVRALHHAPAAPQDGADA